MLASLTQAVSSMFLNYIKFATYRISMISPLLTNLKSSSSEKTLLYISDITRVEMKLGKTRIEYMLRIRSISQRK